ncbi:GNAT family N-acetyltransferase [Neobacillus sp. FSL H8-0543]|uniref:GNAT family N-acetyltransferase n=1 Tax=Neobacillus sp. FSL H8-0543 TaxID=2954672 RepID=UPI0031585980
MPNFNNGGFPALGTPRMNLRILTLDDSKDVFAHFSDVDVTRFMDIEPCKTIKEAQEIIQFHLEDSGCRWGIFEKNTEKFMGTVGFHYLRKNGEFIAEAGFDLSKEYQGKGYMSEAMKEVITFGFSQMKLDMIDATVEPANERSIHLLKKLGFTQAPELKENLLYFFLVRR